MCGIMGAINTAEQLSDSLIGDFCSGLERMHSRGPDDWGWASFYKGRNQWILGEEGGHSRKSVPSERCNVLLGHRRLSIIDLSAAGHQPMGNASRTVWVTFNGEIYNYVELRQELESLGYCFSSGTDTEVILYAYEHWGESAFQRFNGMWGMAIFDLRKGIVLLSRDRFGIKPLYYSTAEGKCFFGSTIDSVLGLLGTGTIRRDVAKDFLLYGLQPSGEDTYIEGISQVPKGGYIRLDISQNKLSFDACQWWHIEALAIRDDEALEAWKETFQDAVRIRMRSDVAVGSCLSGGIDSSAIVAMMHQLAPDVRLQTFTSCYSDPAWDERRYVELLLSRVNASPHWIYPEKCSLMDDLEQLHIVQEQPFPTLSIYNQYCVMRQARKSGVPVLLDGQGADELFMGYDSCQTIFLVNLLRNGRFSEFYSHLRALGRNRSSMGMKSALTMMGYIGIPFVRRARNQHLIAPFLSPDLLNSQNDAGTFNTLSKNNSDLDSARDGWLNVNPLPALLHYEDRNSMAFSIETRLPFLDYRMVNLAFGLSPRLMLEGGWPKLLCRQGIEELVPKEIVWRKDKMGFPAPTIEFMEQHRQDIREMFSSPASSAVIDGQKVVKMLDTARPFPSWFWRFVSFETWFKSRPGISF